MLRGHIYTIGGTAVSTIITLVIARYWALDVGVLTFSSLAISQYSVRKMELPPWFRVGRPEVTSRIFAYSQAYKQAKEGTPRNYVLGNNKSSFLSFKPQDLTSDELLELESRMEAAE